MKEGVVMGVSTPCVMDLYDGLGVETASFPLKSSFSEATTEETPSIANKGEEKKPWASNFQLMASQLQRRKVSQERGKLMRGRGRGISGITSSLVQPSSLLSTIHSEPMTGFEDDLAGEIQDEYDPMVPNNYDEIKAEERRKHDEQRERERKKWKDSKRRHSSGSDDEDVERERERERKRKDKRRKNTSAIPPPMFAPPKEEKKDEEDNKSENDGNEVIKSALQQLSQIKAPKVNPYGKNAFKTSSVASRIMSNYGWEEGKGLGKDSQGISTALSVQKTSFRGGKIVNVAAEREKEKEEEKKKVQSVMPLLKNPTKVVLLQNMVGPGEVDDDLQPEVVEECSKYGEVKQCLIYEIPHGAADDEAVRIFVQFAKVDSAIKAIIDLNGRYFGGRTVKGSFYPESRFERFDLAPE